MLRRHIVRPHWIVRTAKGLAVLGLTVGFVGTAEAQFNDLGFTIEESGPPEAPEWELTISPRSSFRPGMLSRPGGLVLDVDSSGWNPDEGTWARAFPTLEEVYGYLEGDWSYVPGSTFFPSGNTNYEFRFEDLELASPDRALPTSLSLPEGAIIKNGEQFLLSWDYPPGDDSETLSLIQWEPKFDGSGRSYSRRVVSPPSPNGSSSGFGSTGQGDRMFTVEHRNEPGASTNRWLYTLTASEAALPLDVEFTLGAYSSLNNRVWTRGVAGLFGDFDVSLTYLRLAERFNITLSQVPEPTSAMLTLIGVVAFVRCDRRQQLTH